MASLFLLNLLNFSICFVLIFLHTMRQAALLSRLDNPIIVQYLESGKSANKDVYWIVTELLVGSALDHVLANEGPMSEPDAIKVSMHFKPFYL